MTGALRAPSRPPPTLSFMSINVGRGGTTHNIALSRAYELGVDVVLIQEPRWNLRSKETISHPGYICHTPHGDVDVRPRAVTYTRKTKNLISAEQLFPCSTPTDDYCWVKVNGITFLNVYKAPKDSTAVRPLFDWKPSAKSIAAGDLNSVRAAWQPGVTRPYGQGDEIERWAESHNLSCLIIGEPTHKAGNTLDLAWTNISGARAWVDREECMTSDHLPIRGIVPAATFTGNPGPSKIRVPKKNLPNFARAVVKWVHPAIDLSTTEKVDEYAQEIFFHLSEAIKATV